MDVGVLVGHSWGGDAGAWVEGFLMAGQLCRLVVARRTFCRCWLVRWEWLGRVSPITTAGDENDNEGFEKRYKRWNWQFWVGSLKCGVNALRVGFLGHYLIRFQESAWREGLACSSDRNNCPYSNSPAVPAVLYSQMQKQNAAFTRICKKFLHLSRAPAKCL